MSCVRYIKTHPDITENSKGYDFAIQRDASIERPDYSTLEIQPKLDDSREGPEFK